MPPTETSTPSSMPTKVTIMATSSLSTTVTNITGNTSRTGFSITYIILVVVALTGIVIVALILVIVRTAKTYSRKKASPKDFHSSEERNQEVTPIYHPSTEPQTRYDGGGGEINVHYYSRAGNLDSRIETEAEESSTSTLVLPCINDTESTIDEMELPENDHMNSNGVNL